MSGEDKLQALMILETAHNAPHERIAALEARCAGLERERDALRESRNVLRAVAEKTEEMRMEVVSDGNELQAKLAAAEAEAEKMTKERDWHKKALNDLCGDWLAKDHRERIGSHIASLLSYTIIVQGLPAKMTNAEALRENVEKWRSARDEVTDEEISTLKSFIDERNAAIARAEVAEEASPDDIREMGWAVAVHNDYRMNGRPYTFWLFTKNNRAVKGEGSTDVEALRQIRTALASHVPETPQYHCTDCFRYDMSLAKCNAIPGIDRCPKITPVTSQCTPLEPEPWGGPDE